MHFLSDQRLRHPFGKNACKKSRRKELEWRSPIDVLLHAGARHFQTAFLRVQAFRSWALL